MRRCEVLFIVREIVAGLPTAYSQTKEESEVATVKSAPNTTQKRLAGRSREDPERDALANDRRGS